MADQYGGSGNDSFVGGSGDDQLSGKGGEDSISGAGGNDVIYGGDDNDLLYGGDGEDSIYAGQGSDDVDGGAGDDDLYGKEGDDTVEGGTGNDRVSGDTGNDFVSGGDGNDSLLGGAGDDRLDGGAGDDTFDGGTGADVFVVSQSGGDDVITDFSPSEGDVVEINYPGISTFEDLEPLMSDNGNWGTMITFPDGTSTDLQYYNFNSISSDDFTFESGPVCFLRGTMIDTANRPMAIETLRIGDHVLTHDDGAQPIRFISHSRFRFGPGPHKMKPLRIKAGALSPGCPAQDLIVSPQHRIALPQHNPQGLIPVKKMQGLPGVTERPGCRSASYYHLLLDRHALIRANGAWAETMRLTTYSAKAAHVPPALIGPDMVLVRPDWRKRPVSEWGHLMGHGLSLA